MRQNREIHNKLYKIKVKTLQNSFLTFNKVNGYDIEGPFIRFTDSKTGIIKRFAVVNCEIEEDYYES